MNKIKKFKLIKRIFAVIIMVLLLAYVSFLIYGIVRFGILFLVSWQSLLFFNAAVFVPAMVYCGIGGKYEKRLKKEVYGEPTEQDRMIAGELLKKVDVLRHGGKYKGAFRMRDGISVWKSCFADIEKGNKVDKTRVKAFYDMQKQIALGGKELRAQHADFADYIDDACALFKNNVVEI